MGLVSTRAKITVHRIKRYMIYGVITYIVQRFILGISTFAESILYISLVIICFLFEENHIFTKTWKVLMTFGMELLLEFVINILGDWFYENVWHSWIVYDYFVSVGIVLVALSIVIINKKKKIFAPRKVESIIFSKSEELLLCVLAACTFFNPIVGTILYMNREELQVRSGVLILWAIISVAVLVGLIIRVDKNIAENYYQKVNELVETQFRNQVTYYEKIEESNKEIRAIKHDMKNHLISMQSLLHNNQLGELDKYIEDIRTTISKKPSLIRTGNTIVDAILNEKSAVAHDKDIEIDIKVGIQEHIDIELIDLCIILSNSIDNAIEACERIEDVAKRKISIKCSYKAGYFLYEITNPMKEEIISGIKGKLRTIKKDKKNHGFGIGNIQQSVRKYGGEVQTSAENFEFKLEVEINTKVITALQA